MPSGTILMVEDDPDDAELTRLAVAPAAPGYDWKVARDGVEALDLLLAPDAALPTLILLDLNLPRLDGIQVLEKLHAAWGPGLRKVKVAILSSSDEGKDRKRTSDLGARLYLRKPINQAETETVVQAIVAFLKEPA